LRQLFERFIRPNGRQPAKKGSKMDKIDPFLGQLFERVIRPNGSKPAKKRFKNDQKRPKWALFEAPLFDHFLGLLFLVIYLFYHALTNKNRYPKMARKRGQKRVKKGVKKESKWRHFEAVSGPFMASLAYIDHTTLP
jgi:hypothetical protein